MMIDWANLQSWEVILGILAILLSIIAIIVTIKFRSQKSLSYTIKTNVSLLTVKKEAEDKLEIYFDGKKVHDVYMVVIKLFNSGNVHIGKADISQKIIFTFGDKAQVLSVDIVNTDPENVDVSLVQDDQRVIVIPELLNGGDSITFKVIVNKLDEIKVTGRISGVKEIKKASEWLVLPELGYWSVILECVGGLMMIIYAEVASWQRSVVVDMFM